MGVYQDLIKKKIIDENEDGSVTFNQTKNNTNEASDMSIIKGLNQMIDRADTNNMLPVFQEPVKNLQMFTPAQREQYAQRLERQKAEQELNKYFQNLQKPLWEQMVDFANNSGRFIENTWIGAKHGVEDAGDYVGTMLGGVKSDTDKRLERVQNSNLTDEQKKAYMYYNLNSEQANDDRLNAMIENLLPVKNMPPELYNMFKTEYKKQLENTKKTFGINEAEINKYSQLYLNDQDTIDRIANKDEKAEERARENRKIASNIAEQTDIASKKLAEVAPSFGQMLPGMGLSVVNPALGSAYFMTSAGGGYLKDAEERGMSPTEARQYATIMGTLEGLSESVVTGQQANRIINAFGGKGIGNKVLNSMGFNIFENVIQEAIMEPTQEIVAGLVGDKANWEGMEERMFNAGLNGGIMGLVSNGMTKSLEFSGKAYNKIKNGETLTQNEIKSVIDENIKAFGEENTQEIFKKASQDTINQIKQATIENNEVNTENQQTILPIQENNLNQNVVANNQDRENRLQELKSIDTSNMGFIERGKIKTEIRALEQGFNSIEEYQKAEQIKREQAQKEYEQRQKEKELEKIKHQQQLEKEIQESNPTKRAQYEIIQNTNPMLDDYHTGIRSPKDIKTFDEVINDEESFTWGDFSKEDAQNALKQGKITIYSSYPIENGTFVSTSKVQAEDYAGGKGKKVYSKEVPLEEVAWINGDEGQYAKVDNFANNQQVNDFNGYTQKEINNIKSNKISIAQSNEDISKFVNNSRKIPGNFKMYLGKIKESASNLIKNKLGINVDHYNISLKTDDVRKIFKDHGNEKTEIPRGQVPITEKDFLNIPDIINNPDLVSLEGSSPQGKPAIKFEKNIDGNTIVVTYVSDKHNNLEMQTMYKFKNNKKRDSATALHENQTPGLNTSEMDSGTNLINNSILPTNENVNRATNNDYVQNTENNTNLPTQGEEINWNQIEKPEGKFRKHYQSIIESSNTTAEAKAIAKELMGTDTYIPESNKRHINEADTRIQNNGVDNELTTLSTNVFNGDKRVTAVDIAVGERLIEYYSKIGDKAKLQEAIQTTAMAGTQAGRAVQALSLLNHQTPQGQVTWIQRSLDKVNQQIKKQRGEKAPQFEFTAEMQQKILQSENADQLQQNLNEVYKELGQQVPKSTMEKIDSWRYFSMLANPKTHIRNMVGNFFMAKAQTVKNKVAGVIEGVVSKVNPNIEREHTVVPASKKTKNYAKNDIKNVVDRLGMGENKYTPQTRLQSEQRTFKSNILENTLGKMFDLNGNLLEAEDNLGLKSGYVKAFSEYVTANKIDVDTITDTQLAKARNYAVQQAQEATFHQASSLATLLNQLNNNKGGKFLMDSILPFKKTPINVAKTGFQYSPMQIIKSVTTDLVNLRKGNITVNQYIDNLSKGLTGTGIALVGYALADAGVLKASGSDDDRKEKYDEAMGKQTYSIQIGGKTYSLDWLAPTGIPLFIGVEANEIMKENGKEKNSKSTDDSAWGKAVNGAKNILDAFTNSMNPMTEMSMLSGITNALKSYNTDSSQMFADLGTNMAKSYVNQFVPTALSQVARTTDDYERDTTSTKNGVLPKAIDSTINQIKSKIPGLRQTLPVKTDIWGKEVKQEENLPLRALKNAVFPWTEKDISNTSVDKELSNLYEQIGESSILPKNINKTLTLDKETYRMTNEEYNKYKTDFGKTSYKILDNLFDSKEYKSLSNDQKQKAIENVYTYAKEVNKQDYADKVNVGVNTSNMYNTMQKLNTKEQSQYITYLAKTTGMEKEKEKNEALKNLDIDNTTKATIYANNTGKDDKLTDLIPNIKMDQYLDYKIKSSNNELSADKDENGKTISGSAKTKLYEYVNNNISGYENRLVILASKYKMSRAEQQKIVEYINKNSKTNDEVISKLEKLSNNFQVKDGKVYFK